MNDSFTIIVYTCSAVGTNALPVIFFNIVHCTIVAAGMDNNIAFERKFIVAIVSSVHFCSFFVNFY
jgi:hypothetical protein